MLLYIFILQANNAYIFPGLGLGLIMSGAIRVHDDMLLAACKFTLEILGVLIDKMMECKMLWVKPGYKFDPNLLTPTRFCFVFGG